MTNEKQIQELRDDCSLSEIYHENREAFLSGWHRFFLSLIITSSAVLATGLASDVFWLKSILIIGPAILASWDLVFNLSASSQQHRFMRLQFASLATQLTQNELSEDELKQIRKELRKLYAIEPPAYRALLFVCTNHFDMRKHVQPTLEIGWFVICTRNYFRWSALNPKRRDAK